MNEDGTPIQGAETAERPAGQVEGAAAEPSSDEIAELYRATGVKAPVPTGKTKGRPKAATVRAEDDDKNGTGSASAGSGKNADDKGKSKNAPASDDDDDSGNKNDPKGKKNESDSRKVQDESEEAGDGVRKSKSAGEGDSEQGREEDADDGARGTGEDEGDEEGAQEEGKRPGKSSPEAERRIQQLNAEKKEALERAERLEQQLRETQQKSEQARLAVEDPEYTVEDFRKVRDNKTGEIYDLNDDQAELAYRRWKDGYDQRAAERNAEANRQSALEQAQAEYSEQMMRESVEAYDTLAGLMDDFPELVSQSGKFDADFAAKAMPIINEAILYQEGTEPGNAEGNPAVIVGLKVNPKRILEAMKGIQESKRTLPLNGVDDNVESRSSVSVPHTRSSDPNVNAANQLYKELGINKRI